MNLFQKNKQAIHEVKKFVVIFYIVGVAGFVIPYTKALFVAITPLALILNVYLLAIYHKSFTAKTVIALVVVFLSGFFIEVIGVNTGVVFGNYAYGNALGFKVFKTPLLIGLNWAFLTYTATSIAKQLKLKDNVVLFFAPLLMVVYDLVLEQIAPKMDMWSWQNASIPFKNYFAWYVIGLCFVLILKLFKVNFKNPMALILFSAQFVFFLILSFLLK